MAEKNFFEKVQFLIQTYGPGYLDGAKITLLLALVGTFFGCLIGFICGIVQTIPVEKNDSPAKKIVVRLAKCLCGIFPRHSNDGAGRFHLLRYHSIHILSY